MKNNFLQVSEEGHCLLCHEDFNRHLQEHDFSKCIEKFTATKCGPECRESKFYTPDISKLNF